MINVALYNTKVARHLVSVIYSKNKKSFMIYHST